MDVRNLYTEQLNELRERLFWCFSEDDLTAAGANCENWNSEDWNNFAHYTITDNMVFTAFDGYSFTCDDFFSTAGNSELYPDR